MFKKNVRRKVALLVLLTAVRLTGQAITYTEPYKLNVFTDRWIYLAVNAFAVFAFAVLFNSDSLTLNALVIKPLQNGRINIY